MQDVLFRKKPFQVKTMADGGLYLGFQLSVSRRIAVVAVGAVWREYLRCSICQVDIGLDPYRATADTNDDREHEASLLAALNYMQGTRVLGQCPFSSVIPNDRSVGNHLSSPGQSQSIFLSES